MDAPGVRGYLARRGEASRVQANREIAVLSTIFNRAREWGYTEATNPCEGVRRHRERPRDRYVTDAEFDTVWNCADEPMRDAMDLALLTGQREGDVLKMREADIVEGALHVRQNKTGAALRKRFRKAKRAAGIEFQFRDLRAKAATDSGELGRAQKLLAHKNRSMTEAYVRPRLGEIVEPLK